MKIIDIFFYFGILNLIYSIVGIFKSSKIKDAEVSIDPLNLKNSMSDAVNTVTGGAGIKTHDKIMSVLTSIWMIIGFFTKEWIFFILLLVATVLVPLLQMLRPKSNDGQIKVNINKKLGKFISIFEIIIISYIVYHHFFVINLN